MALFEMAFYGKRANSVEPGDSLLARAATDSVAAHLRRAGGVSLVDSADVSASASTAEALAAASGKACNVSIACARAAARHLGAAWAITGTVSKTSNLIWIFSGQLIDVATGKLVMDDEYELKGNSREMVAAGARVFARRVAKRISAPATP